VRSGRGFIVLRGLPRQGLTLDEFAAIVWGIGTHFGQALSQTAEGKLLDYVVDATSSDPTPRMYRTSFELGPHNDPTGMLALACWNPAKSGGESMLVSGVTLHAEIARRAPQLLPALYRGFHYHRLGEQGPQQEPVTPYRVPIVAVRSGQVSCRTARAGYIAGHHELGIPITNEELAAIDLLDAVAREPDMRVTFPLAAGDMLVVNNYMVLHARHAFENFAQPERQRQLLRLWLDAADLRDVPPQFNQMWTANGIPFQEGRRCNFDFQKLFRDVRPELLGMRAARTQVTADNRRM
jgi:hypothetical protein